MTAAALTGTDVAAILGGLGILLSSVGAFIVSLRSSKRVAEVKAVVVENRQTTNDTHAMVQQVDAAVNGKPPGATTMVQQVQDLTNQAFPQPEFTNGDALLPLVRRLVIQMESHIAKAEARRGDDPA